MTDKSAKQLAEHFEFLDKLRDSGITNMWGASPYLQQAYGLNRETSSKVLGMWIRTFDPEIEPAKRAETALAA